MKSQSDLDCIFGKTSTNSSKTAINDPWSNPYLPVQEIKKEIKEEIQEDEEEEERKRRKAEKKERKRKRRLEREAEAAEEEVKVEVKEEIQDETEIIVKKNKTENTEDKDENEFFTTIQSKLSVQDYFKLKMEQLKLKKLKTEIVVKDETLESSENVIETQFESHENEDRIRKDKKKRRILE